MGGFAQTLRQNTSDMLDRSPDSGSDDFSLRFHVRGGSVPDQSIEHTMTLIERKRALAEHARFDQAVREMEGLTDIVVHELQSQISKSAGSIAAERRQDAKHVAFLELAQHSVANVRVESSVQPFPTIAELVQEQQLRRDTQEAAGLSDILELQQGLLDAENEMVEEELAAFQKQMLTDA